MSTAPRPEVSRATPPDRCQRSASNQLASAGSARSEPESTTWRPEVRTFSITAGSLRGARRELRRAGAARRGRALDGVEHVAGGNLAQATQMPERALAREARAALDPAIEHGCRNRERRRERGRRRPVDRYDVG